MKKKSNAEAPAKRVPSVKVRVPRGEDVFVCVNGVGYLLRAMEDTSVPPEIAEEYYRSEAAKDRFYETSRALSNNQL